jgi:hypothetical protein
MTELTSLLLPILLSAVTVFILSSVIHMALPWHKNDFKKLPEQDKVMDALRQFNVPPGDYMMPRASDSNEMKSPEFNDKIKNGPIWIISVRPNGEWQMAKPLIQWFIFLLVVGIFAAYITSRALPVGAHYLQVFRFVGASAFMGFSFAYAPVSIWFGRSWSSTIKMMIDGLIYALVIAGIFGWLWPQ